MPLRVGRKAYFKRSWDSARGKCPECTWLCLRPVLEHALVSIVTKSITFPFTQGSEDSEDGIEVPTAAVETQRKLEASSTPNSDDDAESCPICLNAFRDQAVGTPETCAHYFCLDCIIEWSRVSWLFTGLLLSFVTRPSLQQS